MYANEIPAQSSFRQIALASQKTVHSHNSWGTDHKENICLNSGRELESNYYSMCRRTSHNMENNTTGTEWWHLAWSDAAVLVGQSSANNDNRAVGPLAKLLAFLEASLNSQRYAAPHATKLYLWTTMTKAVLTLGRKTVTSVVTPCARIANSTLLQGRRLPVESWAKTRASSAKTQATWAAGPPSQNYIARNARRHYLYSTMTQDKWRHGERVTHSVGMRNAFSAK